jgi:hypothetical protein
LRKAKGPETRTNDANKAQNTEDIGDLQTGTRHPRGSHGRVDLQVFQRADDLLQQLGRDMTVTGRSLEPLVTQQPLDGADILMLLEQLGGKGVALMPNSA